MNRKRSTRATDIASSELEDPDLDDVQCSQNPSVDSDMAYGCSEHEVQYDVNISSFFNCFYFYYFYTYGTPSKHILFLQADTSSESDANEGFNKALFERAMKDVSNLFFMIHS
jgi:hypothetical protein